MSVLRLHDVHAAYDGIIVALRGVSLEVPSGAIVALLGANGAGKTTTLKAAAGLLGAERGALSAGHIAYEGRDIAGRHAHDLVRAGLVQVLEGRHVFPHFSVEQNLSAGALIRRPSRAQLKRKLDGIYQHFPRLKERRRTLAGFTSGGEQQMLAIGRALMYEPKLVLLDEPSMGLAPLIVEEIFETMKALNGEQGVSFLLAEQNATLALRYSDFGYVLDNGQVAISGTSTELTARDDVRERYLGATRGSTAASSAESTRTLQPLWSHGPVHRRPDPSRREARRVWVSGPEPVRGWFWLPATAHSRHRSNAQPIERRGPRAHRWLGRATASRALSAPDCDVSRWRQLNRGITL